MQQNKFKKVIDEADKWRIDIICRRLKGSVSQMDVINWLKNFRDYEIDKALQVLEKLEYITENEIVELYEVKLKSILENTTDDIIIHPVSDYGKSSTLMVYYLKKTPAYTNNEKRIAFYNHQTNFKHKLKDVRKKTALVFLDDFSGSGKQFNNYYKTYIKPKIKENQFVTEKIFLTLFYLPRAATYIRKVNPEIVLMGQPRHPAFLSKGSVFGYRDAMLPIRDFCFKYGKDIFSTVDRESGIETDHPLGYSNSQALLVFAYNVPNNTLPIIWSGKNWIPLYPRVPRLKMSKSKEIRKELAHEIGLMKNVDFAQQFFSGEKDIGWKSFTYITKTDFITFSLIRLIKQRRALPVICQILGINETDFYAHINSKPEIFKDYKTLTDDGNELYAEIRKQLKIIKKETRQKNRPTEVNFSAYLPKNFKGAT